MKNRFTATMTILCLMGTTAMAQQTHTTDEYRKTDSIASNHFRNGEYAEALASYNKCVNILKSIYGENDTCLLSPIMKIGRCYYRSEMYDTAIEITEEGIRLYEKAIKPEQYTYSYYQAIDNVSVYLDKIGKYKEAAERREKAVEYCYKNLPNDENMIAILIHAAENSYRRNLYEDAINHQEYALRLIESAEGLYSKHYLDEMEYLIEYYDSSKRKESDKKKIRALYIDVKEGVEEGRLPKDYKLTSAEDCRLHVTDALLCARYFLKHPANAPHILDAGTYLIMWMTLTDILTLKLGNAEAKWMKTGDASSSLLLFAYTAAYLEQAISERITDKEITLDQYVSTYVGLLNYYIENRSILGNQPCMEEYISLYQKDPNLFIKTIKDNYTNSNQ